MIVWEEKWYYETLPCVGDYIQLEAECDITGIGLVFEGFVTRVDPNYTIAMSVIPDHEEWSWERWRRGALPEHRSVVRRETVDA